MKIVGRKTSTAYELYGFIPKVQNGKHSAICMACNRVLQNTAAVRLQKHRNSCVAARPTPKCEPVNIPNIETQIPMAQKDETVQHVESMSPTVKTEQINAHFATANINDNTNDNTTYDEEASEATNPSRRLQINALNDELSNIYSASSKSKESYIDQDDIPIQSSVTITQHPTDPFESYNGVTKPTGASHAAIVDNEAVDATDEDLFNFEEDLDVIQDLMPRSREAKQLRDELSKAETEYYRCKAAYFTKLTENCIIKRTLMLLESRKLQLEIEKITNAS